MPEVLDLSHFPLSIIALCFVILSAIFPFHIAHRGSECISEPDLSPLMQHREITNAAIYETT